MEMNPTRECPPPGIDEDGGNDESHANFEAEMNARLPKSTLDQFRE